jgi:hypothetical protein
MDTIDIKYVKDEKCETYRMDDLDFNMFLAQMSERLGITLRDRRNARRSAIYMPDSETHTEFQKEIMWQNIELSRKADGVNYLSFPKPDKEKRLQRVPTTFDDMSSYAAIQDETEASEDGEGIEDLVVVKANALEAGNPTIDAVFEENPNADPREVLEGISLMRRHTKEVLRNFYN